MAAGVTDVGECVHLGEQSDPHGSVGGTAETEDPSDPAEAAPEDAILRTASEN